MEISKDKLVQELNNRKATLPCHRCGSQSFSVLDEFTQISIQKDLRGIQIGGATIPVALVACNNCGAITHHALGALGLLNNKERGNG